MAARGLGYLPDPPQKAAIDWSATEILKAAPLPPSASNADLVPDVLQQGRLGSCTANAAAVALRACMLLRGDPSPEIASRLFLYYLARATHGAQTADTGTFLRAIFQVANKFGFPRESEWIYSDDTDPRTGKAFMLPDSTAFRAAFDQSSPTEYRRIYETGYDRIDTIKRALAERHLVVFGTDVSERFCNGDIDGGNPIPPPANREPIGGGHAMAVEGYDGDTFTIVNSWGAGFGNEGRCAFSADYLAWEKTRDLWIVRFAPAFSDPGPEPIESRTKGRTISDTPKGLTGDDDLGSPDEDKKPKKDKEKDK
jgi:C1A family cysteine protease